MAHYCITACSEECCTQKYLKEAKSTTKYQEEPQRTAIKYLEVKKSTQENIEVSQSTKTVQLGGFWRKQLYTGHSHRTIKLGNRGSSLVQCLRLRYQPTTLCQTLNQSNSGLRAQKMRQPGTLILAFRIYMTSRGPRTLCFICFICFYIYFLLFLSVCYIPLYFTLS